MKCLFFLLFLGLTHCGYNWGHQTRSLPGGHKTVFVEMFENRSQEVGAESAFTRSLMTEFERSGFALVSERNAAELIVRGSIVNVDHQGTQSEPLFQSDNFADGTTTAYNAPNFTNFVLGVTVSMSVIRSRDKKTIWQKNLKHRETYRGGRLKRQGLRSSNVLYNQARRKQTMELIADYMMNEAFALLTENF